MKRLLLAVLCTVGLVACVAFAQQPAFYDTIVPKTFSDSVADSVTVHIDDRLMVWLNGILLLGRREQLEQAACLRVSRHNSTGIWVDSILRATVIPGTATPFGVEFDCPRNSVPIHWHVLTNRSDGFDCIASDDDTGVAWVLFPAEMLDCGFGPDSLVAWKARKGPRHPKAKL